jgi:hypothetical protein
MDVGNYFKSLSLEITGLKNRVRDFIHDDHWLTDGEWKESVLRAVLRRHLPDNVKVGRGFVFNSRAHSKQIDVLLYDASKPILFRDADLVFITDDAVMGIIEVKSKLYKNTFQHVLNKLSDKAEFVNRRNNQHDRNIFIGLFGYETDIHNENGSFILERIKNVSNQNKNRIINHICLGKNLFIRYWRTSPRWQANYNKWHLYDLEQKSYGYFINNIVSALSKDSVELNQEIWFPEEGKEIHKIADIPFNLEDNV